jgi:ferrous iron transport protein A
MTKRLDALRPGDAGVITGLYSSHNEDALARRLNAVGFRVGRRVELIRSALAKGPLHVRVGTAEIMLRRGEANAIEVLMEACR